MGCRNGSTMAKYTIENRIWDKNETLSREEINALQLKRLQETVARVTEVPFYKQAFAKNNITPDSIQSLDDLRRLPFTTKADLREHYPLGFLAVPRKDLVRFHGSSGTTGKPTFVAYTHDDKEMWANLCARFLTAGGLLPEHTAQISFGLGLFTGGFGLHFGIEKVGAAIIPAAAGNTVRQILLLQDLAPETLICTPSYALNIIEVLKQQNIDPGTLNLKCAHFGGEMWTDDMRKQIENDLGIYAFNNYGLSEVIGPGVSGECLYQNGMHIQEDHFIVECINPETLEPVDDYEKGELVFTSLTKQAMPIIRYRTRDIASLDPSPCPCGRTGVRMSRVMGRTDDMLIIRGVNVYPSQIEEALLQVEGIAPHYLIEVARPGSTDQVAVQVEVMPEIFSDKMSQMQQLKEALDRRIQAITGIRVQVNLVAPQTITRSVGKATRVIDHRDSKG